MARSKRFAMLLPAFFVAACGLGGGGVTPVRTPFNKGVYHYSAGRWDAAIAEFRVALEDDESDYRARFNLAMALEGKAREAESPERAGKLLSEAEREYRTLLVEQPGSVRAAVNLAALEYETGRRDAAYARLREALEARPDAVPVLTALGAHLLREFEQATSHSEAQEKLKEALDLLEHAVEEDPADVAANMLLGDVYGKRREPEFARASYRRALERDASDLGTLLALARLEALEGEHEDAATWAQRATYVDPEHVDAHLILATSLEALDDPWRALFHLWRARELDSGPQARREPNEYRAQLLHLLERVGEKESDAHTE